MCRLSWNLGASTSWNPQGLSRPVMGLVYFTYRICKCGRWPRNKSWRAAGWRPMFEAKLLKLGEMWGCSKGADECSCLQGDGVIQTNMYIFQCFGDVSCLHVQGSTRGCNNTEPIPSKYHINIGPMDKGYGSVGTSEVHDLTLRRLMSYIYGAPILDVSRSHTTTQHSR